MYSEIDNIVKKWDLKAGEVEEKKRVLSIWQDNIDSTHYDLLLKICGSFTYYSSNLTESTFKNVIEEDLDSILKEDNFLLFQLTTKETIESSHNMYSNFIAATNLSYSHADHCFTRLSILMDKLNNIFDKVNKNEENAEFNNAETKLLYILKNIDTLIFVDDFIGTGTNVNRFIEENLKNFEMLKMFLPITERSPLNVIIVVLEATNIGLDNITQFSTQYSDIINLQVVNSELAESIFKSHHIFDERQDDLDIIESSFKKIAKEKDLYWKMYQNDTKSGFNLNLNIASYVNTPNNTFPLISQPEKPTDKWEGLFPRKRRKRRRYSESDKELSTFLNNLTDKLTSNHERCDEFEI